jgi:protein-disulfide isomerase
MQLVYNDSVSKLASFYDDFPGRRGAAAAFVALCSVALMGASCGNKSAANPEDYKNIEQALDKQDKSGQEGAAGGSGAPGAPQGARTQKKIPIPGVDLSNLSDRDAQRFDAMVDSLPSPCGKAHSLRTSATADAAACKQASFAARYVAALIADGVTDNDLRGYYDGRYGKQGTRPTFQLADTPHIGPADSRVVLVEFFDYGCPACKAIKPVIDELLPEYPRDVVLYFKQFPLAQHPDSEPAARAAIAAGKQGKYKEMHDLLFADQQKHKESDLMKYAEQLGLDMKRFRADFAAAAAKVAADRAEGDAANVRATPMLFINGRPYEGPMVLKYLKMWIDEELALSR